MYSGAEFCVYVYSADVDECQTKPCPANSICKNTPGGFNCTCKEGYSGKGCSGSANIYDWTSRVEEEAASEGIRVFRTLIFLKETRD